MRKIQRAHHPDSPSTGHLVAAIRLEVRAWSTAGPATANSSFNRRRQSAINPR
ncbi:hypothetical protein ACFVX3_32125 [Rhodococcus erythropolis]